MVKFKFKLHEIVDCVLCCMLDLVLGYVISLPTFNI